MSKLSLCLMGELSARVRDNLVDHRPDMSQLANFKLFKHLRLLLSGRDADKLRLHSP